jgi:hypothetical protein
MASTQNKNTEIDYRIEQERLREQAEWQTICSRRYATNTGLPNVGINVGHRPNDILARNATDIESRLYGIGLSNLVEPVTPVRPEPIKKSYHPVQFFEVPHCETIIPDDLVIARDQRPVIFRR